MQSHVRGYSLMFGTLSAAQVADWLCSTMPATMKPALLTKIAVTVDTLVRRADTRPATAWGAHASSSKSGPSNAASAARTASSRLPARSILRGDSAQPASLSSAAAPASTPATPVMNADDIPAGERTSPAGVPFVSGASMAPSRSDYDVAREAAIIPALAASLVGVADVEDVNVVDA